MLSLTAIETSLPGFGWEKLADVAHGVGRYAAMEAPTERAKAVLAFVDGVDAA